jgi:hypothetical protein
MAGRAGVPQGAGCTRSHLLPPPIPGVNGASGLPHACGCIAWPELKAWAWAAETSSLSPSGSLRLFFTPFSDIIRQETQHKPTANETKPTVTYCDYDGVP